MKNLYFVLIFFPLVFFSGNIVSGQASTEFPPGTYTMFLSEQNIPNADMEFLIGEFSFTFHDGQYVVEQGGQLFVEGVYTATAEEIDLTDTGGPFACDEASATYSWALDDDQLMMTSINDECTGRVFVLTVNSWHIAIPLGAYSVAVSAEDVPENFAGDWALTFFNNYYTVQINSRVVVVGQYTISGDQVTVSDLDGPFACIAEDSTQSDGTYAWSYLPGSLTLNPVADNCRGRATIISRSLTRME